MKVRGREVLFWIAVHRPLFKDKKEKSLIKSTRVAVSFERYLGQRDFFDL